jgi:hypothetical protein
MPLIFELPLTDNCRGSGTPIIISAPVTENGSGGFGPR